MEMRQEPGMYFGLEGRPVPLNWDPKTTWEKVLNYLEPVFRSRYAIIFERALKFVWILKRAP